MKAIDLNAVEHQSKGSDAVTDKSEISTEDENLVRQVKINEWKLQADAALKAKKYREAVILYTKAFVLCQESDMIQRSVICCDRAVANIFDEFEVFGPIDGPDTYLTLKDVLNAICDVARSFEVTDSKKMDTFKLLTSQNFYDRVLEIDPQHEKAKNAKPKIDERVCARREQFPFQ